MPLLTSGDRHFGDTITIPGISLMTTSIILIITPMDLVGDRDGGIEIHGIMETTGTVTTVGIIPIHRPTVGLTEDALFPEQT